MIRKFIPYKVRRGVGRHIKFPLILGRYYLYDLFHFKKYCVASAVSAPANRQARIIALYHVLEKGLSFRDSRPFFGKDKVLLLISELKAYANLKEVDQDEQFQSALKVLSKYYDRFFELADSSADKEYMSIVHEGLCALKAFQADDSSAGGGWVDCNKVEVQRKAKGDFPEMALSRYSVRDFSNDPVPDEIIKNAVFWAQKSPSVCNRQSSRIYALRDKRAIADILEIHGGTKGFAEQIDVLLLVAGDLRVFFAATIPSLTGG